MTAETLKPFIQSVESFPTTQSSLTPRRQRNISLLSIGISAITLVLLVAFACHTVWLTMRLGNSETEISKLNRVIENMHKRLGINYLDELQDFEKQYSNALIDDPSTLDGISDDYDDDDDSEEDDSDMNIATRKPFKKVDDDDDDDMDINYDEQIEEYMNRFNVYDDDDDDDEDEDDEDDDTDGTTSSSHSNTSEDTNLLNDFELFKGSKKKSETSRLRRSITHASNEAKEGHSKEMQQNKTETSTEHIRNENQANIGSFVTGDIDIRHFVNNANEERRHRTPLRQRHYRRHRFPIMKSGESLISAKYSTQSNPISNMGMATANKPAAHFHIHRKITDRRDGDVYIAHHPSWSNEVSSEHYFPVENGMLTVREPGLYYVYAQICYNNTYDKNGFIIFHNHLPFLQCLNTVPTNMQKLHTCHTSGLIYLKENESIHLRDIHTDRDVILKDSNNRSYFGLMKV